MSRRWLDRQHLGQFKISQHAQQATCMLYLGTHVNLRHVCRQHEVIRRAHVAEGHNQLRTLQHIGCAAGCSEEMNARPSSMTARTGFGCRHPSAHLRFQLLRQPPPLLAKVQELDVVRLNAGDGQQPLQGTRTQVWR